MANRARFLRHRRSFCLLRRSHSIFIRILDRRTRVTKCFRKFFGFSSGRYRQAGNGWPKFIAFCSSSHGFEKWKLLALSISSTRTTVFQFYWWVWIVRFSCEPHWPPVKAVEFATAVYINNRLIQLPKFCRTWAVLQIRMCFLKVSKLATSSSAFSYQNLPQQLRFWLS